MIRVIRILCLVGLLVIPALARGGECVGLETGFEEVLGITGSPVIRILDIQDDSPAGRLERDGLLKVGDLITGFNGNGLTRPDRFMGDLRFAAATGTAEVEILAHDPDAGPLPFRADSFALRIYPQEGEDRLGVAYAWSYLVRVVPPGSPAHRMGLRAGDFVESIDGEDLSGLLRGPIDLDLLAGRSAGRADPGMSLRVIRWEPRKDGFMKGSFRTLEGSLPRPAASETTCP